MRKWYYFKKVDSIYLEAVLLKYGTFKAFVENALKSDFGELTLSKQEAQQEPTTTAKQEAQQEPTTTAKQEAQQEPTTSVKQEAQQEPTTSVKQEA